jgi:hypothetical protein
MTGYATGNSVPQNRDEPYSESTLDLCSETLELLLNSVHSVLPIDLDLFTFGL